MASAQSPSSLQDFLRCPICLETYKQPRCLPCLHSFCHSCLQTYISSQKKKDDEEKTGFPCPVCRTFTPIPGEIDPDKWPEQLPFNPFIDSYIGVFQIEKNEKLCDSCSERNEEKKAVSWCTICSEAFCEFCTSCHKSFKVSRQHTIVDISTLGYQALRARADINCFQHKTEPVKIYCKDHKIPCCHMYATLHHRKCENVVSIEEAAKEFRSSEAIQELTKSLCTKSEALASLLEKGSSNVKSFQEQAKQIEKEISSFRTNLNSHLDTIETKVREDLAAAEKNFTCNSELNEAKITELKRAVDNCKTVLETSATHGSDVQCLVEYNRVKEQEDKFNVQVKEKLGSFGTFDITFRLDKGIQNLLKISSFGEIGVQESPVHDQLVPKLALEGKIVSKHQYTSAVGMITGTFVANKIVIIECDARQVTILGSDLSYLNKMTVQGNPRGVTLVDGITEVVAIMYSKRTTYFRDLFKKSFCA